MDTGSPTTHADSKEEKEEVIPVDRAEDARGDAKVIGDLLPYLRPYIGRITLALALIVAAKLANQATRRLFEAAGGSALHESNALQRIFRDVTAGCAQARLHWDEQAEPYAKILVGEAQA